MKSERIYPSSFFTLHSSHFTLLPPLACALLVVLTATAGFAQTASTSAQTTPVTAIPPHDISGVDIVAADGAMATPLPVRQQRRLKKYDLPELTGSRQAVGSQLVDGHLPRPLVDYVESAGELRQRISFFEGGLVVIDLDAPWVASIHKRLIIPDDVLKKYLDAASPKALNAVDQGTLRLPAPSRRATVRIYDGGPPHFVERSFDPIMALPKSLSDVVTPLQDLMRAAVEDRQVTNTVANYIPKEGDELVGDDRAIYRVQRVVRDQGIVVLKCLTKPTTIFVKESELANYFIGKPAPKP